MEEHVLHISTKTGTTELLLPSLERAMEAWSFLTEYRSSKPDPKPIKTAYVRNPNGNIIVGINA